MNTTEYKKNNFKQAKRETFGIGIVEKTVVSTEVAVVSETAVAAPETVAAPMAAPYTLRPISFFAADCAWEGTIRSEGDVEVAGTVRGDITARGAVTLHNAVEGNVQAGSLTISNCALTGDVICDGAVTVGSDASVNGAVTAKALYCAGKVCGDLSVGGNTELTSSARVVGNMSTGSIAVEQGAVIRGGIEIKTMP